MAIVEVGCMAFRVIKTQEPDGQVKVNIMPIQALFATDRDKMREKVVTAICYAKGTPTEPLTTDQVTEEMMKEFIESNSLEIKTLLAEF
jgi:hypothetical protein